MIQNSSSNFRMLYFLSLFYKSKKYCSLLFELYFLSPPLYEPFFFSSSLSSPSYSALMSFLIATTQHRALL